MAERKHTDTRISLYLLTLEEAVKRLVRVPPPSPAHIRWLPSSRFDWGMRLSPNTVPTSTENCLRPAPHLHTRRYVTFPVRVARGPSCDRRQ
jgi:hypothetical protein